MRHPYFAKATKGKLYCSTRLGQRENVKSSWDWESLLREEADRKPGSRCVGKALKKRNRWMTISCFDSSDR
jgi:hypothetical protein